MSNSALLRAILKELRKTSTSPKTNTFAKYIISQFRQNEHTTEQSCSPMHESIQLADTYLTLLQSVARHQELVNTYKCREKSTSEAANLVGLSLPKTYSDQ
nr:ATP synthase assembly factor FMC1 mitochondrial [Hymenolepis microstoma]